MGHNQSSDPTHHDVLIVGAGPAGLACAIELQRAGLDVLLVEKGCVVQTLTEFPTYMRFFTSCDGLELGGIPMVSVEDRPGRTEAVKYYQRLVGSLGLRVRQYEVVHGVRRQGSVFSVRTSHTERRASTVIMATGFFHGPVLLGVPGEDMPTVMHHYREPHAYFDQRVLVVGGRNSAGAAAIELCRAGAHVTIVHRGSEFTSSMKPWLREELLWLIARGKVRAYFQSHVKEILRDEVLLQSPRGLLRLPNDFVFALTGYRPDLDLLSRCGVKLDSTMRPIINPLTLESSEPGLYLAGVVVAGLHTNELNISHAREHARQIAQHACAKLRERVA